MFAYFIAIYFFILPFQWALSPIEGVDLAIIRLFSLSLLIVWLTTALVHKKFIIPLSPPLFWLSSFLFTATLSFLWAENEVFSLRKTAFLWSFFPLFWVLAVWFKQAPHSAHKILSVFVLGGFGAALVSLFQFLSQFVFSVEKVFSVWTQNILPFFLGSAFGQTVAEHPSLLVNISGKTVMRASAFFPDPHMFSLYIGMIIPIALYLWILHDKKILWAGVVGTLLIADLLSFSRGGYIALFIGPLFFMANLSPYKSWDVKKTSIYSAAFIFLSIALVMSPIGSRLSSSFSLSDGSNIERLRLWKESITYIQEKPLLGVGLGNYPITVKPSASYRDPIYAHNLYLDIVLELGVVGLIFFLGLLFTTAGAFWKKWRDEGNILMLALLTSLIIFSVHSLFETPIFSVHVLPALLLILALGVL